MGYAVRINIAMEPLNVAFAFGSHLNYDVLAKRVYNACANAVQTAGEAVCIVIEFAAGVQLGIHNLNAAHAQLFMYANGYAAAVILNGYGIILIQCNVYRVRKAVGGFVHGVVNNFPKHVVQPARTGGADVHARAHTHGLQPLHNLYIAYGIVFRHIPSKCAAAQNKININQFYIIIQWFILDKSSADI